MTMPTARSQKVVGMRVLSETLTTIDHPLVVWSGISQGKSGSCWFLVPPRRLGLILSPGFSLGVRTVLSSAGNDGRVRLWKATAGSVWRPAGHISVEQAEEIAPDVDMDENPVAD